jgi:hypothetical protein
VVVLQKTDVSYWFMLASVVDDLYEFIGWKARLQERIQSDAPSAQARDLFHTL